MEPPSKFLLKYTAVKILYAIVADVVLRLNALGITVDP
jgi:hypothetical protein